MSLSELLPSTLNASALESAGGLVLMVGVLVSALRWLLGLPAPQPEPVPVPVRREQRPQRRR
jgi:hypothetical protein